MFMFVLARSLIECVIRCSYYGCECKAGLFYSALNKCNLLDKNFEQLKSEETSELIYFERNPSNISMQMKMSLNFTM